MLRFRYFQVFFLPGFYSIVFFPIFLFISWFKKIKKSKNNINPQMYKGEEGWVCHRHRPLRFFWVFSHRPKHQHLMFPVAVRSSIHHSFARILSRVQWWSVSMVTGYNVISRRWSSHFWVKVHVFSSFFFSAIKVNLVAKIMQSAYFVLFFFSSTKKSPSLAVLTWFLILGKIQDGDHCWWRHRPPRGASSHKVYLIL